MNYEPFVDRTDFGTVRRYLRNTRSPISEVLLVASLELLSPVAALLDAEGGPILRRRQLEYLARNNQLVSLSQTQSDRASAVGFSVEQIPDDTRCHVLFLPPVYLVHVPGLNLARARPAERNRSAVSARP